MSLFTEALSAFLQVIMIDLVLAGDNAVVIGLAASTAQGAAQQGHPDRHHRRHGPAHRVALSPPSFSRSSACWPAASCCCGCAWKMRRAARAAMRRRTEAEEAEDRDLDQDGLIAEHAPRKTFAQAAWQIVVADVDVVDNVLAVAGAVQDHPVILVFGLGLSIALMGIAASFIARLLQRHHWIAYVGLAVILYVAVEIDLPRGLEVWPYCRGQPWKPQDELVQGRLSARSAMPSDTNPAGDIFGGWLMAQMDLAAGNAAARPCPRALRDRCGRWHGLSQPCPRRGRGVGLCRADLDRADIHEVPGRGFMSLSRRRADRNRRSSRSWPSTAGHGPVHCRPDEPEVKQLHHAVAHRRCPEEALGP